MRVVLVTPRFAPDIGGVERVVEHAAAALVARGASVVVVTASERGRARRESITCPGGTYMVVRALRPRWLHRELVGIGLWRAVRRAAGDADVVHIHSYHALAALVGTIARRGRPLVATLHYHGGGHSRLRSMLHVVYRPFGRWLVRQATAVVCNTAAEASLVHRDFPGVDTVVVANPVVVHDRVGPDAVDTAPSDATPTRRPVVVSVSRLAAYKRVDVLVAAARQPGAAFDLVVVGDGEDRERLERLAGDAVNISFTGRVDDEALARWWRRCDLVASASEDESFGLVVAEALASGVRCVASAIEAHRELVTAAGTGVLVDGWDPAVWAAAISAALATVEPAPSSVFCSPHEHADGLAKVYLTAVLDGTDDVRSRR